MNAQEKLACVIVILLALIVGMRTSQRESLANTSHVSLYDTYRADRPVWTFLGPGSIRYEFPIELKRYSISVVGPGSVEIYALYPDSQVASTMHADYTDPPRSYSALARYKKIITVGANETRVGEITIPVKRVLVLCSL